MDVEHFKNIVLLDTGKAEEKLMNSWYPKVIGLFSGEECISSSSSLSASFHECVATLIGNKIRTLLTTTVLSFVEQFKPQNSALLPVFRLQLCLDESEMVFFPSPADLEVVLLSVVDTVAKALQSVGRIQVHLVNNHFISLLIPSLLPPPSLLTPPPVLAVRSQPLSCHTSSSGPFCPRPLLHIPEGGPQAEPAGSIGAQALIQ